MYRILSVASPPSTDAASVNTSATAETRNDRWPIRIEIPSNSDSNEIDKKILQYLWKISYMQMIKEGLGHRNSRMGMPEYPGPFSQK